MRLRRKARLSEIARAMGLSVRHVQRLLAAGDPRVKQTQRALRIIDPAICQAVKKRR
jgi:hypothetical protein